MWQANIQAKNKISPYYTHNFIHSSLGDKFDTRSHFSNGIPTPCFLHTSQVNTWDPKELKIYWWKLVSCPLVFFGAAVTSSQVTKPYQFEMHTCTMIIHHSSPPVIIPCHCVWESHSNQPFFLTQYIINGKFQNGGEKFLPKLSLKTNTVL